MINSVSVVGDNIKRLRTAAGFGKGRQRAFAEAVDIANSHISDWEKGRYPIPEIANLIKLAKVLRVSIDDIIEGYDQDYDAAARRRTPSAQPHLTAEERELIDLWRHADHLSPTAKQSFRNLLIGDKKKQRHSA
jgi:transcriptional regulator with XRE-family HTH domain